MPPFLTRQVPVSRAGRVVIKALESRSPRAIAPWEWAILFHGRGATQPLLDLQFDTDATLSEIILGAEQAELDRQESAEVSD